MKEVTDLPTKSSLLLNMDMAEILTGFLGKDPDECRIYFEQGLEPSPVPPLSCT